jgi:hypothetical protein
MHLLVGFLAKVSPFETSSFRRQVSPNRQSLPKNGSLADDNSLRRKRVGCEAKTIVIHWRWWMKANR